MSCINEFLQTRKQSGNSLPRVANLGLLSYLWPSMSSCAVSTGLPHYKFRLCCRLSKHWAFRAQCKARDYQEMCVCREYCSKPHSSSRSHPNAFSSRDKLCGTALLYFLISSFSTVATHNIHLKLCPSNKDYKEFTLFSAWREIKY